MLWFSVVRVPIRATVWMNASSSERFKENGLWDICRDVIEGNEVWRWAMNSREGMALDERSRVRRDSKIGGGSLGV